MKPSSVPFAFAIALLAASCDSRPKPVLAQIGSAPAADSPINPPVTPAPKPTLVGNSWLAEDIGGKGVIDNARTFIRFEGPDKVSGNGGINKFSGTCTLEEEKLTIGPLRSTKMAGPPALMQQEAAFHEALAKVKSFKFDENGTLFLHDAEGKAVLRLTALKEP